MGGVSCCFDRVFKVLRLLLMTGVFFQLSFFPGQFRAENIFVQVIKKFLREKVTPIFARPLKPAK